MGYGGYATLMRGGWQSEDVLNCYGYFAKDTMTPAIDWTIGMNYIAETPQVDSVTYRITDDESVWKNVGTGTNPDGTQANLGVYGGEYSWEE